MLTKLRLTTQIIVLLGIVCVTYMNHYENQKVKYGWQHVIGDSVILKTIDKVAGKWENRSDIMRYVQGDVWAAQIGSVKVVDPLAFFGNLTRTKKVYGLLFFAALIPIVLTVLLGKVFCSWICPMGLLFEINDKIRQFLIKKGVPLFQWAIPYWVKYVVLVSGLMAGLLLGAHFFFVIYPPKLVSGEIYFWVTRASFSAGMLFIFAYLAVELIFAPRIWCRSLCPGGAVYTLLSKFRVLRIKNDLKNCTNCGICDKLCPYGLTPSVSHISPECDHCSICISKCPVNTLSFIVGKDKEIPVKQLKNEREKKVHASRVALWAIICLSPLFFVGNVNAHHIRGLPHYGYAKNYPQTPTYQELRTIDHWEISYSFIRIFETKYCDLAVYIKDTKTGKPYKGAVTFQVFGRWEDPADTQPFDTLLDPTNTFRVQWVYEEDGVYTTRLRFKDGQKEYVEDFKMQLGKIGFNPLWFGLPGLVVLILILLVVFKRKETS